MALTVTAAFNEFQRNIVNLDSSQTDRARASRDWLLGRMNTFPNNDVYFPIIYPDIHTGFGSFARRTKIRPLDDIDLMFGLDGDDCVYSESDGKIIITAREGTVRLKYYKHDGTNFINSRKIINSFISSLNQIPQYDKADVKRNQEAATLKLKSYDWNFDIVPAFITTPDSFLIIHAGHLNLAQSGHYNFAVTYGVRITKIMLNVEINDLIINMLRQYQSLPHSINQSWKFKEQSPLMSLRCRKSMVSIEAFSFFSKRVNHYRTDANILSYAITA